MPNALITGTNKGIGLAIALALARAGYTVHATMRNPKSSSELSKAAESERLQIQISMMDVDSDSSVRDTIAGIQSTHGPIDVLVNNAGIVHRGAVEELPLSEFRALMETNYLGVVRCVQAVMPEMRKRKSGLHHQCQFRGRTNFVAATDGICRIEMGIRSTERRPGAGSQDVQHPGRCR